MLYFITVDGQRIGYVLSDCHLCRDDLYKLGKEIGFSCMGAELYATDHVKPGFWMRRL